ncbi:MAG TPA: methyltransferase domain-containing protein [Thermoanaerobaculia bacterium]
MIDFDLASVEKVAAIDRVASSIIRSPAIDVGCGLGWSTRRVLGDCEPVALDAWYPNLLAVRRELPRARMVQATAAAIPFADDTFATALCSEVLEHVEDDAGMVAEIARVLRPGGHLILTVPSLFYGFDSYLHRVGLKTVHDFPGPEQHVRPGYSAEHLRLLLAANGVDVVAVEYIFKPATKLMIDAVSLGNRLYQRVVHGRSVWTWSDVADQAVAGGLVFRAYRLLYPLLRLVASLDRLWPSAGGFGLVLLARKRDAAGAR